MTDKLKKPAVILCILLALFTCILIQMGINQENFCSHYIEMLGAIPYRYMITIFIIIIDYSLYAQDNYSNIICRYKSLYLFLIYNTKKSIKYNSIYFILTNIFIILFNLPYSINNLLFIIIFAMSNIIVMSLIISIIRIIDLFIHNRIFAGAIFLSIFALINFLLEHYNYFLNNFTVFDLSAIYILPSLYNFKMLILIFLILINVTIFLVVLSTKLMVERDYIINDKRNEKN